MDENTVVLGFTRFKIIIKYLDTLFKAGLRHVTLSLNGVDNNGGS